MTAASDMMRDGTGSQKWTVPPSPPSARMDLVEGEVHVWLASTGKALIPPEENVLSTEEQVRAARFFRKEERDRYIAAHVALRKLLSRYTQVSPASIRFSVGKCGKPAVIGPGGPSPLHFNLAHSHSLMLVAVANNRDVGVDIEYRRGDLAVEEIAEKHFHACEASMLHAVDKGQRTRAFFDCWTRKEAYLKARGVGLSAPLNEFSVSFGGVEPARVVHPAPDSRLGEQWSLFDLPIDGYSAALAVARECTSIRCWQWEQ